MSNYCISVPIVYDWLSIMTEMKKCVYIPTRRDVKHMEDCICIHFHINCENDVPTTVWQAVGNTINAASFSITHNGTCACDWLILANDEELATITSTNTFSATVGDLERLSVVCVNGCSEEGICEGRLDIVVHYLINIENQKDKQPKKVTCFLSDKHGNPINSLSCREIGQNNRRESKCFLAPNGEQVFLQKVSILIEGYVSVKITDVCDDSFVICTYPIRLVKNVFLCAPDGTDIICKSDRFSCHPCIVDSKSYKDCTKVCLDIDFCLNVQSQYKSVVSIEGNLCEPRADLKDRLQACYVKGSRF